MTGSSGETRQKRAERICIWHVIRTPVCRRSMRSMTGTPHEGHQEIFGRHDWYYSDAYRTIANIAMDWLWFGRDPWQQEIAGKLQSFYCEKQSGHWDGVFLTDGTLLRERALHPVAVIAVNAEASLAAKGENAKECIRRFWETPLRTGERRYYDNFLYLFAMLALSGNYRIY